MRGVSGVGVGLGALRLGTRLDRYGSRFTVNDIHSFDIAVIKQIFGQLVNRSLFIIGGTRERFNIELRICGGD